MALFGNLAPLNSLLHQHFPVFRQSHLSSLVDDSRELYYPIYWGWRIRHGGAEENQRVERDDVAAIEHCSLVHRVKIPSNYRHTDYRYIHCTAQFFFARQQGFTPLQQANEQKKLSRFFPSELRRRRSTRTCWCRSWRWVSPNFAQRRQRNGSSQWRKNVRRARVSHPQWLSIFMGAIWCYII